MQIPMLGYKMIYKNVIYNLVCINIMYKWASTDNPMEIEMIDTTYIDENNRLVVVRDIPEAFQFMSK